MAKRKVIKKVSARKGTVRTRSRDFRTVRNRTVSFFIGVITVLLIGFLLFDYAQNNNYKTVLGAAQPPAQKASGPGGKGSALEGEKTNIIKQNSKVK